MELPIQLKFFKKIELYQEYQSQEKKIKKSGTNLRAWNIEKRILSWVADNHHHLASAIQKDRIEKDILGGSRLPELDHALNNLEMRGYAQRDILGGIITTKEGLLMAEVVSYLSKKKGFYSWFNLYSLFLLFVWITVICGIAVVIRSSGVVNFVFNVFKNAICFFTHIN